MLVFIKWSVTVNTPSSPAYSQPVAKEQLARQSCDADFIALVSRAIDEGFKVTWHECKNVPFADAPVEHLHEWIAREQETQRTNADARYLRVVSGEFNPVHWNLIAFAKWKELLEGNGGAFSAEAICSPFVALGPQRMETPSLACPWHAVDGLNSRLFEFFLWAAYGKMPKVALYRSETRMSCHWVATGNRMSVTDWHEPLLPAGANARRPVSGDTGSFYGNTVRIDAGDTSKLRRFAEDEFKNTLGEAADVAFDFRASRLAELEAAHNGTVDHFKGLIPEQNSGGMERLADGFNGRASKLELCSFADVALSPIYRCGAFILSRVESLRDLFKAAEPPNHFLRPRFPNPRGALACT